MQRNAPLGTRGGRRVGVAPRTQRERACDGEPADQGGVSRLRRRLRRHEALRSPLKRLPPGDRAWCHGPGAWSVAATDARRTAASCGDDRAPPPAATAGCSRPRERRSAVAGATSAATAAPRGTAVAAEAATTGIASVAAFQGPKKVDPGSWGESRGRGVEAAWGGTGFRGHTQGGELSVDEGRAWGSCDP